MTLEVVNLSKSFGERRILNDISFKIPQGQIVFFLGQSGTGKSVLLKNIVGLMKPEAGQILIQGEDITQFSESELLRVRKNCGLVFQQPALFDSLTIYENLAFGLRRLTSLSETEIQTKANDVLESVHLDNSIFNKKPAEISYGMQKRVSLARTLILEPQILLFDEPTTGLDPVTTTAVNRLIKEVSVKYKTTSIVVSHDMKCAMEIADRIIFLDKGQIIFDGAPKDVKSSSHELVSGFFEEIH